MTNCDYFISTWTTFYCSYQGLFNDQSDNILTTTTLQLNLVVKMQKFAKVLQAFILLVIYRYWLSQITYAGCHEVYCNVSLFQITVYIQGCPQSNGCSAPQLHYRYHKPALYQIKACRTVYLNMPIIFEENEVLSLLQSPNLKV